MFDYENVLEVLWKGMLVGMASLMVAAMVLTWGCAAFDGAANGAYRAGRAGAVAFMLTENVQSPVTRTGLVIAYRAWSARIGDEQSQRIADTIDDMIEDEVDAQLERFAPDATPELRAAAVNAAHMLRARLRAQMSELPEKVADRGSWLEAFKRGVDDALRDYGYAASDEGV